MKCEIGQGDFKRVNKIFATTGSPTMQTHVWFEKATVIAASTSHPSSCNGNVAALLPDHSMMKETFISSSSALKQQKR